MLMENMVAVHDHAAEFPGFEFLRAITKAFVGIKGGTGILEFDEQGKEGHQWENHGRGKQGDAEVEGALSQLRGGAEELLFNFEADDAIELTGSYSEAGHTDEIWDDEHVAEPFAVAVKQIEEFVTGKAGHTDDGIRDFVSGGDFKTAGEGPAENAAFQVLDFGLVVVEDGVGFEAEAGVFGEFFEDEFAGDAVADNDDLAAPPRFAAEGLASDGAEDGDERNS
jgi:hypothetical protein